MNEFEISPKPNQDWRKSKKWLDIKGISRYEIENFCGAVERGTPLKTNKLQKNDSGAKICRVGKYKGQTYEEVKAKDSYYWRWYLENVLKGKE